MKKPIEKILGMKCISCANFTHQDFGDIVSRLWHGWRNQGGQTFGHCAALDCDDAVGCHRVIDEAVNHLCRFVSAGTVDLDAARMNK